MLAKEAYPILGGGGILVKQCLDLNCINFINNFLYKNYALVYILVHSICINFTRWLSIMHTFVLYLQCKKKTQNELDFVYQIN